MGKVRPGLIKRLAREALEKYSDKFSTDFEENKKALEEIMALRSRKMRNRIAGYITKLKKIEARGRLTPATLAQEV